MCCHIIVEVVPSPAFWLVAKEDSFKVFNANLIAGLSDDKLSSIVLPSLIIDKYPLPVGIAELRPSQGKPGSIVFVTTDENGNKVYSSTLEGDIDRQLNTITITTLEENSMANNGIENIAVLYITARGTWADQTEHSYIVDGIVGPDMTFENYTISQPAQ